ncbi:MAG: HEAT repeat domain-containing protein [Planctomycetes bacterium]|nr:HEAT repeat domain-containing protein [Planctomycetota bacterium]
MSLPAWRRHGPGVPRQLQRCLLSTIACATLATLCLPAGDAEPDLAPVFDPRLDALAPTAFEPTPERDNLAPNHALATALPATPTTAPAAEPTTRRLDAITAQAHGDGDALEESLRQLGALAAKAPEQATAVADRLLALEAVAAERSLLPIWLDTLTVTAAPSALPAARRHLAHELPPVRAAAITAVLRIAGAEARDELTRFSFGDPSPLVRTRAVTMLASHHDQDSRAALERVLAHETDADVRVAALLVLAQHPDRAATEPLLRRHAAADPATGLRAVASQLLASR